MIEITFWGVRGSTPTPHSGFLKYGGNTSCIELRFKGLNEIILVDGGSGLLPLGDSLIERYPGEMPPISMLLTHFHWDHIQGVPFFAPLYHPSTTISIYAVKEAEQIQSILKLQMDSPYFPYPLADANPCIFYSALEHGRTFELGSARIEAFPLHHPQGATGYRFEVDGAVFVHLSDHEPGNELIDTEVLRCASGADVLVCDAQYTAGEYAKKRGWGHGTFIQAAALANKAGVGKLMLFHHDPRHDDAFLERMLLEARQHFAETYLAQERKTIRL